MRHPADQQDAHGLVLLHNAGTMANSPFIVHGLGGGGSKTSLHILHFALYHARQSPVANLSVMSGAACDCARASLLTFHTGDVLTVSVMWLGILALLVVPDGRDLVTTSAVHSAMSVPSPEELI